MALFTIGINTNLRASGLLRLKVGQVKDLKAEDEVEIKEKKICKGRDIGNISSPATKTKLLEILEREANSKQGHKIAMDVMQSDTYRNQSYERVVEYFNALLKGFAEQ